MRSKASEGGRGTTGAVYCTVMASLAGTRWARRRAGEKVTGLAEEQGFISTNPQRSSLRMGANDAPRSTASAGPAHLLPRRSHLAARLCWSLWWSRRSLVRGASAWWSCHIKTQLRLNGR